MSVHDFADLLTAISSLIGAVGSVWAVLATLQNRRRIADVQQSTNGLKDELVQATGDKRFLEGLNEGRNGDGNGKG